MRQSRPRWPGRLQLRRWPQARRCVCSGVGASLKGSLTAACAAVPLPPLQGQLSCRSSRLSAHQVGPPSLLRGTALTALVPLPALKTQCGNGVGLAACPALGLLVTSSDNCTLSVWGLPCGAGDGGTSAGGGGGLRLVCTLGGDGSAAPMQFKFGKAVGGGRLAFTSPSSDGSARPLLLVTDGGADAVHLVDVVDKTHAGYLASPGSIAGPRGVAASGASPLVAVSAWKDRFGGDHVVVVYRGEGVEWEAVRVIGGGVGAGDGQLNIPVGLRFSWDGTVICVADYWNNRASVFRADDGGLLRHIIFPAEDSPRDVEVVEGGWLAACSDSAKVEFVSNTTGDIGGRPSLGKAGGGWGVGDGEFMCPSALAVVPGLGLVVREYDDCGWFQVFAAHDTIAMTAMSCVRVAWMVAVARAALRHVALVSTPHFREGSAEVKAALPTAVAESRMFRVELVASGRPLTVQFE